MDFEYLMKVQSALNDFTLKTKQVYLVDSLDDSIAPQMIQARISLRQREGEKLRHLSALVQMCDMYQWAGNREYLELEECIGSVTSNPKPCELDEVVKNAKVEVVDIMHFDLSLLALTCATGDEVKEAVCNFTLENSSLPGLRVLNDARNETDALQLRKWWTSNKVKISDIREKALKQFAALLTFACEDCPIFCYTKPLFTRLEEVVDVYEKKVEVNYQRIKADYDHIKNAEMGNANVK